MNCIKNDTAAFAIAKDWLAEPVVAINAWEYIRQRVSTFNDEVNLNEWWRSSPLGQDASWQTKEQLTSFITWKIADITSVA